MNGIIERKFGRQRLLDIKVHLTAFNYGSEMWILSQKKIPRIRESTDLFS
jgi:hypothetical protein